MGIVDIVEYDGVNGQRFHGERCARCERWTIPKGKHAFVGVVLVTTERSGVVGLWTGFRVGSILRSRSASSLHQRTECET
jgi:hypothetical protein